MLISVDVAIFLVGIFVASKLKRRYPNFCFLAKGCNVFLPPQEVKQAQAQQPAAPAPSNNHNKHNKKPYVPPRPKQKKNYPIKFVQAELSAFQKFPMFEEYEKVALLMVLLVFHLVVSSALKLMWFLPEWFRTQSSLPVFVYTLLAIYGFYYAWKIITHNGFRSEEFKASVVVILVLLAVYAVVAFFFESYTDKSLDLAVKSQTRHLKLLLSTVVDSKTSISSFVVQLSLIVISCVLTLVSVPGIMKYGNAYTQLLKEAYADEEDNSDQKAKKPQSLRMDQERLRLSCQKKLKIFNIEMTLSVALLLIWGVPQVRDSISSPVFQIGRALTLLILTGINLVTFRQEIEIHLATGFKYLRGFQQSEDKSEQLLKNTQRKVYSYIYYFWYPCYQLMFKIMLPVLLLFMTINKTPNSLISPQAHFPAYEDIKYHYEISNTLKGNSTTKVNLDTSCGLIRDPVLTLKNLYKCSGNSHLDFNQAGFNGWQLALEDLSVRAIAQKVSNYGLFSPVFEYQALEYVLWYVVLSKYTLTIFYILFLRKTVFNL